MAKLTNEKRYAFEWIDEHTRRFSEFHSRVWSYAEPAWREYKSAKAYCDLLRAEGFAVEESSGEMPTAFCARWGKSGPVLGTYAEYDAVPGNSQQVVPYQAPRTGFHPWSAGHTDPHSARRHSPGRWQRRRQWRGSASPAPCCSSASPPKRSAAQCRCTLPRAITTAPTPSSLITRTSPTQRSATRSAALIGALFSRSRQSRRRGGSTRASFRRPTPRMRRPAAWVRSTRSA